MPENTETFRVTAADVVLAVLNGEPEGMQTEQILDHPLWATSGRWSRGAILTMVLRAGGDLERRGLLRRRCGGLWSLTPTGAEAAVLAHGWIR